MKNPL